MRYPSWIQIVVLVWLLSCAVCVVWFQLELREPRQTKTRRLRIVRSKQDGAVEGRSLGPALRTRNKIRHANGSSKG